ncbi:hypothetical protein ACH4TE_13125 [Streptomyces sioyaensis]
MVDAEGRLFTSMTGRGRIL